MLGRVYDLEGKAYNLNGFSDLIKTRRVNGEKELTLTLHKTEANAKWFDSLSHMWKINWLGEIYIAVLFNDDTEGETYTREVSCIYQFYDDLRNDFQYNSFSSSKTFDAAMNFILEGTGYTFSTIDFFYAQSFENFGYDFRLDLFFNALERYGAEFTENDKHITFRSKIGETSDFQYRHKFNIESVQRQIDALDFSTYGKYFGKDGLMAEYRSPLADMYLLSNGRDRHVPSKTDNRITIYDTLFEKVKKAVDDSLKIAITFKFEDMRAAGYKRAKPQEGDTVLLVEERLGLKVRVRVVEIVEVYDHAGNVIDCDVTVSNFTNLYEQQKRQQAAIKNTEGLMEGTKTLPFEALDRELQRMARAIFSSESQVEYNDDGIVARSLDNPNHLLILNSAGILISTDNGQTARLAITAEGIATELLTAGSIYTNNIKIVGDSEYFYWDGSGFYAIDPTDTSKFVRIRSDGLYIAKGAMSIERPDGYVAMNNGLLQNEFSIQSTDPDFIDPDVDIAARYYRTTATEPKNCNAYFYGHYSRYLKVRVVHHDNGSGIGSRVSLHEIGNGSALLAQSSVYGITEEEASLNPVTLTIDLGVPTGEQRGFYLRLNTNAGGEARGRRLKAWLEG